MFDGGAYILCGMIRRAERSPSASWSVPAPCALLAALAALGGLVLIVAHRRVSELALPFAGRIFGYEGPLPSDKIAALDHFLDLLVPGSFLLAAAVIGYGLVLRRMPRALPESVDPAPARRAVGRAEVAALLALLAVATAIRWRPMDLGLGIDEISTASSFVETDTLWESASTYVSFNNHVGYSVLAHLSCRMFGEGEVPLRIPALVLGLASLVAAWVFSRRLLGPLGALACVLALTISPVHVAFSASARGYSGLILFALVSSHLYFGLLLRPRRRRAAGFVLASAAGIYLHAYAAWLPMIQILHLAALARFGRPPPSARAFRLIWQCFPAIFALTLLLYAPVLPNILSLLVQSGPGIFSAAFPIRVVMDFSGKPGILLSVAAMIFTLVGLWTRRRTWPREVGYVAALFVIPVTVAWLAHPIFLYTRFFLFSFPFLVMFLVAGIAAPFASSQRRAGAAFILRGATVVLALALAGTWSVDSWHVEGEGIRDAMQAMQTDVRDSTVFCAIGGGSEVFRYYGHHLIHLLESLDDLEALARTSGEIRCLYRPRFWEAPAQTEIARFLEARGTARRFGNIIAYTYRP